MGSERVRRQAAARGRADERGTGPAVTVQRATARPPAAAAVAPSGIVVPSAIESLLAADLDSTRIRRSGASGGLPAVIRRNVEAVSGLSMADVRVHYDSPRPAQLDALAFTQGQEIHVAPGEERHLAHEAWHVVQQAEGRVRPSGPTILGQRVNDDRALEHEADRMGSVVRRSTLGPVADVRELGAPANAAVQLVRKMLGGSGGPVTLAILEPLVEDHLQQARELKEEVDLGFWSDEEKADGRKLASSVLSHMKKLRAADPGATSFTQDDLKNPVGPPATHVRDVLVALRDLRKLLNAKFGEFTAHKQQQAAREAAEQEAATYAYVESAEHKSKNSAEAKAAAKAERDEQARAEEAAERKRQQLATAQRRVPGLANWGQYTKDLKWRDGLLTFYQFVPNGAATAVAAVRTQDIRDAVYHTGKAFWLADPQNYEISSAKGKTRMEYTFTGTGAKSMWEDHLLCASGDYPEVNLEPWAGEARHPYFSLWKVNEIGARGVGEQRLEELADSVVSIRAFDASGTEITAD